MLLKLWRKLFPVKRYHNRANGPVLINPDSAEVIHVYGKGN